MFAGAGSLVRDHHDGSVAFQIAQRSQFFEVEVGLETTLKRPIVNTRDEPADPERYRRLHVIIGDANMNEVATFLKTGSLAIVLNMIEDGVIPGDEWQLANPVQALRSIAKDPALRTTVERKDGRRLTACELQWHYLDAAKTYLKDREVQPLAGRGPGALGGGAGPARGRPPEGVRTVDWATKYQLMQQIADRDGLEWEDAKLALVDLQYHDVHMDKGLYYRLAAAGRVERLVAEQEITTAVAEPPADTRAFFRGRCLARYAPRSRPPAGAIIFDIGRETLQRVPMLEPTRGTAAHTAAVLDASPTAEDLIRNLQADPPSTDAPWLRRPWPGHGTIASTLVQGGTMARDSGGGAEQKRRARQAGRRAGRAQASPDIQEKGEELKEELDALLDEIDDVLEENAEEFVKQYVQKGGE